MKKFNLLLIVYIVLFCFAGIAQTNKSSDSKKVETNRGLQFKKGTENRVADSSYTEVIQLLNLSKKAQALQFRILINKADDDSTVLIFKDIQKGSDLSDPSWLLDYNAKKSPVTSNGSAKYEIFVVLYNSKQNGGLSPGNYPELLKINYKIASLPNLKMETKSSMKISHAEASTFNGFPIDIASKQNELKIHISRK